MKKKLSLFLTYKEGGYIGINKRGMLIKITFTSGSEKPSFKTKYGGEIRGNELQDALGLSHRGHCHTKYFNPAINDGVAELTIPNKQKNVRIAKRK